MVDTIQRDIQRRARGRLRKTADTERIRADEEEKQRQSREAFIAENVPGVASLRARQQELEQRKAAAFPAQEAGVLDEADEAELQQINQRISPTGRPVVPVQEFFETGDQPAPPPTPEPQIRIPLPQPAEWTPLNKGVFGQLDRNREAAARRAQERGPEGLLIAQGEARGLAIINQHAREQQAAFVQSQENQRAATLAAMFRQRPDLQARFYGTVATDDLEQAVFDAALEEFKEAPNDFLSAIHVDYRAPTANPAERAQQQEDLTNIVQAFTGVDRATAEKFFEPRLELILQSMFPGQSLDSIITLAEQNPAVIIERARKLGRSWKTQTALKMMYEMDYQDIGEIFNSKRVVMNYNGKPKTVIVLDNGMLLDDKGQTIGRINPKTHEAEAYSYWLGEEVFRSITAGVGDAYVGLAGYLGLLGQGKIGDWVTRLDEMWTGGELKAMGVDGWAKNMSEFGHELQGQAVPDTLGEFTWEHMFNPRWYVTKGLRTGTMSALLMLPAIAGGAAVTAATGGLGLGPYAATLIQALGMAAFMRPMESALEAGFAYDQALAEGRPVSEAADIANQIFELNLGLVGLDVVQFAAAFAPAPGRIFSNALAHRVFTAARIASRLVMVGGSEASEEILQNLIERWARDEDIVWDAELQEAAALGFTMGVGLGGGPTLVRSIKSQTIRALPKKLLDRYNDVYTQILTSELGAIRLTNEEGASRITKFLDSKTDAERVAFMKKAEERGVNAEAMAGMRADEWFVMLERPNFGDAMEAVAPGSETPFAKWMTRTLATERKRLDDPKTPSETLNEAENLFFDDFKSALKFINGDKYQPLSLLSSLSDPAKPTYRTRRTSRPFQFVQSLKARTKFDPSKIEVSQRRILEANLAAENTEALRQNEERIQEAFAKKRSLPVGDTLTKKQQTEADAVQKEIDRRFNEKRALEKEGKPEAIAKKIEQDFAELATRQAGNDVSIERRVVEARALAEKEALDSVANEPEVQQITEAVVEKVEIEELEKQSKPKTPAKKVVNDATFAKRKQQAKKIPEKTPTRAQRQQAEIDKREGVREVTPAQAVSRAATALERIQQEAADPTFPNVTEANVAAAESILQEARDTLAAAEVAAEADAARTREEVKDQREKSKARRAATKAKKLAQSAETVERTGIKAGLVGDMEALQNELESAVVTGTETVKGLRGDEAKVAREGLKGLQRELDNVARLLDRFEKNPDLPDATVLRATISTIAKIKGLTKKELQGIYRDVSNRRQLRNIPQEQLVTILERVRAARATRIDGKTVITQKTEDKIATLLESLMGQRQITQKSFKRLLRVMGLSTTKYENAFRFITETEGKQLIRAMNEEVPIAEWEIQVEESLAQEGNEAILAAHGDLMARSGASTDVTFDGEPIKISRVQELRSMRYYVLEIQKRSGVPLYDVWQRINTKHLSMRRKEQILINRLEESTPEFKDITTDPVRLKRVENFIAAKNALSEVESPADITESEKALAAELEKQLKEFTNDVRFARFVNSYAETGGNIDRMGDSFKDLSRTQLRRAIDIYEGQGATALRAHTDTQTWGVIESGYVPTSIIKPSLATFRRTMTGFGKSHIRTRTGVEYQEQERDLITRYRSYIKQMHGLTEMQPLVRGLDRLLVDNTERISNIDQVASVLSLNMDEMKGYPQPEGLLASTINRIYAQVASSVFVQPALVFRNKFQNWAFNPDYHKGLMFLPTNKPLTAQQQTWFEIYVAQLKVIEQDYLLQGEAPIRGFGRFTKAANKVSLYSWSDKSNRAEAYYVRMNRVQRAIDRYDQDGDLAKLIRESGLSEFEPRQQAEALELLAMNRVEYDAEGLDAVTGREAFARYNAQQLVNNVHFLYDRAQRAPAEQGSSGKTLGNILVFGRSWGERFVLQGSKIKSGSGATTAERVAAAQVISGMLIAGFLANATYKFMTGKDQDPYNPLNIFTWAPGGLALGAVTDMSEAIYDMLAAATGNKEALSRLPSKISQTLDVALPLYKIAIQAIEAGFGRKNLDIQAFRSVLAMIDEEYEVRGGAHVVDRNGWEAFQKIAFGGEIEDPNHQDKAHALEEKLGTTTVEDWRPWSIEPLPVFGMRQLGSGLGQVLDDMTHEEINADRGLSARSKSWADKRDAFVDYDVLPNRQLYKINADPKEDTFEQYHNQFLVRQSIVARGDEKALEKFDANPQHNLWRLGNFGAIELSLLRKYHKLDRADQPQFLIDNPEITVDPSREWLKEHPADNGLLALWTGAPILSMEAYNEFNRLVKKLDVPSEAIPPKTLPPAGSIDLHFEFEELLETTTAGSWEARILLDGDDAYREWRDLKPNPQPLIYYELKASHRDLYDQEQLFIDTLLSIKEGEENYKKGYQFKIAEMKDTDEGREWVADDRRADEYAKGATKELADWAAEWGEVTDNDGASSHEGTIWLDEHREFLEWRISLEERGPIDNNIAIARLQVKGRDKTDEFEKIPDGKGKLAAQKTFKLDPLNAEWAADQYRIDALQKGTNENPTNPDFVREWVERGQLVDKHDDSSAEVKVFMDSKDPLRQWAIGVGLLTSDGSRDNISVLTVQIDNRDKQALYDAISSDNEEERNQFRRDNLDFSDNLAKIDAYTWDPEMNPRMVNGQVQYSREEIQFTSGSAEIHLWRARDKTGINAFRESIPEDEPGHLKSLEDIAKKAGRTLQSQVRIWEISSDYRAQDEEHDALSSDNGNIARERYLAGKPGYRKARRERDALEANVPEKHIATYIAYYEEEDVAFGRERFLQANQGFYRDVWLGVLSKSTIPAQLPGPQFGVIFKRWRSLFERWDGDTAEVGSIANQVRLLPDGDAKDAKRRELQEKLYFNNPGFEEDRLRYEAFKAFVPLEAVEGYVEVQKVIWEGKTSGWETWYADDRELQENPVFYRWLVEQGMDPIDFSKIPSEKWEREYNETYLKFRLPGGAADLDTRTRYRGANKAFDLEGVRIGVFSRAHRNRTPTGRGAAAQASAELAASASRR
jgi:hypothetical protein